MRKHPRSVAPGLLLSSLETDGPMKVDSHHFSIAAFVVVTTTAACGGAGPDTTRVPVSTTRTSSATYVESATTPRIEAPPEAPVVEPVPAATAPASVPTPQSHGGVIDFASIDDAQVAAALDAFNDSEITLARLALTHATGVNLKEFGERIVTDYGLAAASLRSADAKDGVAPRDGRLSDRVRQRSDGTLLALRSAPSSAFDRVYIDSQVERQQGLLDIIERVMPYVKSAALKSHLRECKHKAIGHLRAAMTIQALLRS